MTRCWAFTLAWNEALLIPYWVRHYTSFCERVIVYVDTTTDDNTVGLAAREGAEVRSYEGGGVLDDMGFVNFAKDTYPEARGHADYVIWADADEILWHPRLKQRLEELHAIGITLPSVVGYAMVSDSLPTGVGHIYAEIRCGLPAEEYGKVCIFDPRLDVTWAPGKHTAQVGGAGVAVTRDGGNPLRLLHYRYFGEEWLLARNARNWARVDYANRQSGHGKEVAPEWTGKYSAQWFKAHQHEVVDVVRG